jgi:butyrate kinase
VNQILKLSQIKKTIQFLKSLLHSNDSVVIACSGGPDSMCLLSLLLSIRAELNLNLIVAHIGGGASFGVHKKGKTINVTNALAGEGPMSPERSGQIPAQGLIELCFSGKYTKEEILYKILGGGGLFALLGTKDLKDLEIKYPSLDKDKKDVVDEMLAGFSRYICSLIPDFEGEQIDQILLTGGVVRWPLVVESIKKDLAALNIGITVYPGEFELEALRDGAIRVLSGKETAKEY